MNYKFKFKYIKNWKYIKSINFIIKQIKRRELILIDVFQSKEYL